ncbi:MAG TPA: hypothetical protein VLT45_14445 [Kofleriaceae bacterium]|nr:hypothetical protein [Kofleriaceae bacterium]
MGFTKFVQPATERTHKIFLDIDDHRGQPALIVRYAGHGNDAYVNGMYKRPPVPGAASAERDKLDRELDAPILAETVVVGWEHIYEDGSDTPAPFETAKVTELLLAIARSRPALFIAIRTIARTEAFFREPAVASEDLGKG